ncbi:protein RUFY3 isoform X4 [Pleurodeles waltl]|uniref:protein RUFY3 isoform X4 n=1 Tax=Pleurodeles waltl TaxID=8319 RepID=UPI003709828B
MAEPPRPLEGWSGPATVGGPRRRGDHDEGAGARCDSPVSPLPPPVFLYPGARQRPQQAASGSSPELGGGRTVVAGDGDSPLSPSSNLPLLMMMMNYPGVPGSGDRGALSKKYPNYLMANERMNLMNMAKLSIKGLIESALNLGRTLDSDYAPLQQFFVVMEHCLKHGLKGKKTFLGQNKSFWGPLELVEKLVPEASEITASVKDLPGLKTPVGRGRAWLRLALMQKKLSEYMKALINRKDLLSEFYEPNALMMEEEGAIIAGLLVGLNVIDANFCMKGEDLDSQVGVIDFSMYLKDGSIAKGSEGDGQITAILDQKNYVEELNRQLSATVNNLQAKVDALEKSNTKLTEELAVANNRIITMQEEMERMKDESSYMLESNRKATKPDKTGNGSAVSEARKHLKEETQLRLDVEKELEVQIGMRQEMELAMKMLEKDVCEKQDALAALRQQLDDLRAIKLELTFKLQSSDLAAKQKSELNSRLEEKTNQMAATIKQLEQRLHLEIELKREKEKRSPGPNTIQPSRTSPAQSRGIQQSHKNESKSDRQYKQEEKVGVREEIEQKNNFHVNKVSSSMKEEQDLPTETVVAQLCSLCKDDASLMQHKNLCKNCGDVFCDACSANELPLPSSINPERVCNPCHEQLIQQYSLSPL